MIGPHFCSQLEAINMRQPRRCHVTQVLSGRPQDRGGQAKRARGAISSLLRVDASQLADVPAIGSR
jgi:hypothetical protein